MPLLSVRDLTVAFPLAGSFEKTVLDRVSFDMHEGEILGLVGESGSGKSMTAYAIAKLLPPKARVVSGSVLFEDRDLLGMNEPTFRRSLRGKEISIIFQDVVGTFNPVSSVGTQIEEMIRLHRKDVRGGKVHTLALDLLTRVRVPDVEASFGKLPSELSGGMAQRAEIAMMALVTEPKLLIADEPTTALDVTTQAQVLDLLVEIVRAHNLSLLFITHDFGLVAEYCDRVVVLNQGRVEEIAETRKLFKSPNSAYTRTILSDMPRIDKRSRNAGDTELALSHEPVVEAESLYVHFPIMAPHNFLFQKQRGAVRAVDGGAFSVHQGEIFGIVGESGCGKTTLARTLLGLQEPNSGVARFWGRDRFSLSQKESLGLRRRVQGVAQNPQLSLDPQMCIRDLIGEGLDIHGLYTAQNSRMREREKTRRVKELMGYVELPPSRMYDFPGRMSGGEQQRVAIARALATSPHVLVLDEPTSSLDTSRKQTILNLVLKLQKQFGHTYFLITHELPVVAGICDRVAVMYLGKIVEMGTVTQVFDKPLHPYTQALLSSLPIPDPELARRRERIPMRGGVPSAAFVPSGCRFHTRCPFGRSGKCDVTEPVLEEKEPGHIVACHFADQLHA